MTDRDNTETLLKRVHQAHAEGATLRLVGHDSKRFYGHQVAGETVNLADHCGIINYEPTELVITARAGTPLDELEATLRQHGQMLPFEPPHFEGRGTIGGAVATGLSGPRRWFAGPCRDFVLGVTCINGHGELLHFGGEVMKNVAGYDISRLMTGAQGTLGILLDVSLKVLPMPEEEWTLAMPLQRGQIQTELNRITAEGFNVTGAALADGHWQIRIAGSKQAVTPLASRTSASMTDDQSLWNTLRHGRHPAMRQEHTWRLSLPPNSAIDNLPEHNLIEGGTRQAWLAGHEATEIRALAQRLGGHAARWHGGEDVFEPLPPAMLALQKRIKQAFDPKGIFNPGRIYQGI